MMKPGSVALVPPAAPKAGLPSAGISGVSVAWAAPPKSGESAFACPDVSP